jgi:hypothetical protein
MKKFLFEERNLMGWSLPGFTSPKGDNQFFEFNTVDEIVCAFPAISAAISSSQFSQLSVSIDMGECRILMAEFKDGSCLALGFITGGSKKVSKFKELPDWSRSKRTERKTK